jgi:NADH:ubiquinone oxidoreductase subunit 4 (subunit M)
VEAPTVGSIILAGLLLKIGTFGMLRFMFPGLNLLNLRFQTLVYIVCVFSLYYSSLVAIRQIDMKKVVAYSSISHMSLVVIGLFSITLFGFVGSVFTMLSHGVVAPALFFLVGVLYDRYGSRILLNYGGIASPMPLFGTVFFIFILANIGFPSTSNFVGELMILLGVTTSNIFVGVVTTFSIVLGPFYSL